MQSRRTQTGIGANSINSEVCLTNSQVISLTACSSGDIYSVAVLEDESNISLGVVRAFIIDRTGPRDFASVCDGIPQICHSRKALILID